MTKQKIRIEDHDGVGRICIDDVELQGVLYYEITIRTYNVRFLGYPIRAFTTLRPLRVLCKRLTTVFAHYGLPFKRVYIFFFT